MGFSSAGLAVQDQRAALGDEVRPEIGAEQGLPQARLQGEIELIDGLEEGEMRAARATLQTGLLTVRHLFGQQQREKVAIRPVDARLMPNATKCM